MGVTTTKPPMSLDQLRSAGKQIARQAGGSTVQAFFEAKKDVLAAVLPKHMTPDRMLRIAMGALRTTPDLAHASIESLFGAVVACSQLGLEPNTPQGHVYLIPFEKNSKKDGKWHTEKTVQVIIGYKGLVDLARRSGQIVSISARMRCQHDEWRMVLGTEDTIHHVPAEGERGPAVGFYAVAKLKDGGVQFEYMSLADIEKVKTQSKASRSGPWVSHFDEMAKKTVVRRLCKMLPMSIELARAAAIDEVGEAGKAQGMDRVLDGEWSPTDDATLEVSPWALFDADGLLIQADAAAGWETACREALGAQSEARGVAAWRSAMEEHFEMVRGRDAAAVQRIEDAAQARMDELAGAQSEGGA